jgi:hypothetical protein
MNGKKIPYTPEGMKFFEKQKAAAKTGDASRGDLVDRSKSAKSAAIKKKMSGGN